MKKLARTKLTLDTQTIRVLDTTTLTQVAGGGASNLKTCATCTTRELGVIGGVIPVY